MDQSLKDATPIRNELTKISSACSPFWKEPSKRSHQIENWKWQEQSRQLKRMGVENNPNPKSIKVAQAARKAAATTGGTKKPHRYRPGHCGPLRNKEIPKIDRTPY